MYCNLMKKEHDLTVLIQEERNAPSVQNKYVRKSLFLFLFSFSEADSEVIVSLDRKVQPVPD